MRGLSRPERAETWEKQDVFARLADLQIRGPAGRGRNGTDCRSGLSECCVRPVQGISWGRRVGAGGQVPQWDTTAGRVQYLIAQSVDHVADQRLFDITSLSPALIFAHISYGRSRQHASHTLLLIAEPLPFPESCEKLMVEGLSPWVVPPAMRRTPAAAPCDTVVHHETCGI